jgi:hypothetical protein
LFTPVYLKTTSHLGRATSSWRLNPTTDDSFDLLAEALTARNPTAIGRIPDFRDQLGGKPLREQLAISVLALTGCRS